MNKEISSVRLPKARLFKKQNTIKKAIKAFIQKKKNPEASATRPMLEYTLGWDNEVYKKEVAPIIKQLQKEGYEQFVQNQNNGKNLNEKAKKEFRTINPWHADEMLEDGFELPDYYKGQTCLTIKAGLGKVIEDYLKAGHVKDLEDIADWTDVEVDKCIEDLESKAYSPRKISYLEVSEGKVVKALEEDFYVGCFVIPTVRVFAYKVGPGKGCKLMLNSLLFAANGEPVGGNADEAALAEYSDVDVESLGVQDTAKIKEAKVDEYNDSEEEITENDF